MPASNPPRLREVVLDTDVSGQIAEFAARIDRFDDAWRALEWRLTRDADIGWRYHHETLDVRMWKQGGLLHFGSPDITVLYVLTDAQAQIKSVRVVIGGKEIQASQPTAH